MPAVKPGYSEKWSRVTPQRAPDYESGVRSPRVDWQAATSAAEPAYQAGIQQAIAQKRYTKGVSARGTAGWQKKTIDKGMQRWGPGVQMAREDYERGFAPFAAVIERTTLPPRAAKGDPRNIERVAAVARALNQAKVSGGK